MQTGTKVRGGGIEKLVVQRHGHKRGAGRASYHRAEKAAETRVRQAAARLERLALLAPHDVLALAGQLYAVARSGSRTMTALPLPVTHSSVIRRALTVVSPGISKP